MPGLRAAGVTAAAEHLARLRRRGFRLEYASVAWMTAEAAVAITAGVVASSVALTGFGLDSVIEFFAAAIVVWQLRGEIAGHDRETRAVRLIGVTFFALAAYLAITGIRDLVTGARPRESVPGLVIAAAALLVMPGLAVPSGPPGGRWATGPWSPTPPRPRFARPPPPPPWPVSP